MLLHPGEFDERHAQEAYEHMPGSKPWIEMLSERFPPLNEDQRSSLASHLFIVVPPANKDVEKALEGDQDDSGLRTTTGPTMAKDLSERLTEYYGEDPAGKHMFGSVLDALLAGDLLAHIQKSIPFESNHRIDLCTALDVYCERSILQSNLILLGGGDTNPLVLDAQREFQKCFSTRLPICMDPYNASHVIDSAL